MNSSTLMAVVLAFIFAIIAFFIYPQLNATTFAILIFTASLISSFLAIFRNTEQQPTDITTLYVGNLPYRANEAMVKDLFSQYGIVQSVRLMKDKQTGKRRGFGFVEISTKDADMAINALNDTEFQQRTLKVREAKEKPDQS